jgi:hypothetical protein
MTETWYRIRDWSDDTPDAVDVASSTEKTVTLSTGRVKRKNGDGFAFRRTKRECLEWHLRKLRDRELVLQENLKYTQGAIARDVAILAIVCSNAKRKGFDR